MLEKFKNIFKNSFKNTNAKISFLFLTFLGMVVPKFASAGVVGDKVGDFVNWTNGGLSWAYGGVSWATDKVADPIVNGIMYLIFSVVLAVSGVFLEIAQYILNKVISPNFIIISFTGIDNTIVQKGWLMVRDFTNMFIVLGFVIIALATILRIREYHAQKLLPLLIGIALLINFTPVICGFIIDVSNITMNHFLQGAGIHDSYLLNSIWAQCAQLNNIFDNEPTETLAMGFMFSGFAITAGVIYLLFAVLFFFRYIALWVLIILSPLAFFCYILPATKSVWNLWWKQFFQWCIIGIPAAFFLWLSKVLTKMVEDGTLIGTHGVENAGFEIMVSYLVIIAFLLIGFLVSLQTGAMGASAIIKGTTTSMQKAGKWGGKIALKQTAGRLLTTEKGEKIMKGVGKTSIGKMSSEKLGKWAGKGGKLGKAGFLLKGGVKLASAATYPMRWAMRAVAKEGLKYGTKQSQEIDARKEENKKIFGKDTGKATATYGTMSPLDYQGQSAMGLYAAETGGAKGLAGFNTDQLYESIEATAIHNFSKLDTIVRHMIELIDDEKAKEAGDIKGEEIAKLIQKTMISDEVKVNTNKNGIVESFNNKDLQEMYQDGIKINNKSVKELMESDQGQMEFIREATYKKAIKPLKFEDISNLNDSTLKNKKFQENVARYKPQSFIKKLGEEKGASYSEDIQNEAEEIGIIEIAKTNAGFLRLPYTQGGEASLHHWKVEKQEEVAKIKDITGKNIKISDSLEKDDINKIIEFAKTIKPEQIKINDKTKQPKKPSVDIIGDEIDKKSSTNKKYPGDRIGTGE